MGKTKPLSAFRQSLSHFRQSPIFSFFNLNPGNAMTGVTFFSVLKG
jgi:hypothetical protein